MEKPQPKPQNGRELLARVLLRVAVLESHAEERVPEADPGAREWGAAEMNRLTTAVTPSSTQPTKPVVTHSAGGPSRAQERFGNAGPARRQHPNRGTQQSG